MLNYMRNLLKVYPFKYRKLLNIEDIFIYGYSKIYETRDNRIYFDADFSIPIPVLQNKVVPIIKNNIQIGYIIIKYLNHSQDYLYHGKHREWRYDERTLPSLQQRLFCRQTFHDRRYLPLLRKEGRKIVNNIRLFGNTILQYCDDDEEREGRRA